MKKLVNSPVISVIFVGVFLLGGIIFLVLGIFDHGNNFHYSFFPAAGSLFTATVFFYTISRYQNDQIEKTSQFYLEQSTEYFNNSISLIEAGGNNNIKWHQAIKGLLVADMISKNITLPSHQEIYVANYKNTAYSIFDILNRIDDPRFFFGVADYKNKSFDQLFFETSPKSIDLTYFRISSEPLSYLARFLEKASRAEQDFSGNKTSLRNIFNTAYFKRTLNDSNSYSVTPFSGAKIILNYINGCEALSKRA